MLISFALDFLLIWYNPVDAKWYLGREAVDDFGTYACLLVPVVFVMDERGTGTGSREYCEEKNMLIYLMRHGETDWNKARRLQGQSDIPLNANGTGLAAETARGLAGAPIDMAFCSPLMRARETAEIILGDRNVPLYADERLKEIHFGANEGICFDAAKQNPEDPLHDFFCRPEHYLPPEGAESFAQVTERGQSFLREKIFPLEGKCRAALIVAHGAFNRCLLNCILGTPLKDFWRILLPNCAVSILSLEQGEIKVVEESRVYYEHPVNGRP